MAMNTHAGMGTYEKILQDCRVNGSKIGPKHHEYNKQFKTWAEKNPGKAALVAELSKPAKKEAKQVVKAARKNGSVTTEVRQNKTIEVQPHNALREKLERENKAKLAESYKIERDGREHKSAGNGL
jgi:hypothetical protein